jgi:hypothetical protein
MSTTTRILTSANMAATLAFAIWALFALRRWTRSSRGKETVSTWSPSLVVPAQTVIALLWWQMLLDAPWTAYVLYQFLGDWSLVLARLLLVFLLLLLPGSLVILDVAWMRLHRIPSERQFGRIWRILGWVSAALVACLAAAYAFHSDLLGIAFGVLFIFVVVSAVFLTAWWLVSHPVLAE